MIIKEYVGSLDLVDEKKLAKVKKKADKLEQYKNKVEQKNGNTKESADKK